MDYKRLICKLFGHKIKITYYNASKKPDYSCDRCKYLIIKTYEKNNC